MSTGGGLQPGFQRGKRRSGSLIVALAAGREGVGKGSVCANVGFWLASLGTKTVLVDADIRGIGLHRFFGVDTNPLSLDAGGPDLRVGLSEALLETGVSGLRLISGAGGLIKAIQARLFEPEPTLRKLGAKVVLVNLSVSTDSVTLGLFNLADLGIMVTTPSPEAVEGMYEFLKSALVRDVQTHSMEKDVRMIAERTGNPAGRYGLASVQHMVQELNRLGTPGARFALQVITQFRPKFVLNMAREGAGIQTGSKIQEICRKLLGVRVELAGVIEKESEIEGTGPVDFLLSQKFPEGSAAVALKKLAAYFNAQTQQT